MTGTLTIESLGGSTPLVAEGQMPDGRRFWFRARYNAWELRLAENEDDLYENPSWHWSEPWGDRPYAAGYMTEEDGQLILESCAAMLAAGVAAPEWYRGVAEEEVQALRFAQMLVDDVCIYESDALAASKGDVCVALAAQIQERREAFRERMPAAYHPIFEDALVRIEGWRAERVVHERWLCDAASAQSVGRRIAYALGRETAQERPAMKAEAVRWLESWTATKNAAEIRAAWLRELG